MLDGPFVLTQYVPQSPRFQITVLNVYQDADFPRLERGSRHRSAGQFTYEAPEAIEHQFAIDQVVGVHYLPDRLSRAVSLQKKKRAR